MADGSAVRGAAGSACRSDNLRAAAVAQSGFDRSGRWRRALRTRRAVSAGSMSAAGAAEECREAGVAPGGVQPQAVGGQIAVSWTRPGEVTGQLKRRLWRTPVLRQWTR